MYKKTRKNNKIILLIKHKKENREFRKTQIFYKKVKNLSSLVNKRSEITKNRLKLAFKTENKK